MNIVFFVEKYCSTRSLAVTRLTVYRQMQVPALLLLPAVVPHKNLWMATCLLDVRRILLLVFNQTLHASIYLYKLTFVPSGVSVYRFYVEDDPRVISTFLTRFTTFLVF